MKWFQHQSNSHRDFNVEPLVDKYGMEGYGLFWLCGEIIAEKGISYKITEDKGWKRYLMSRSKFPEGKLNEILNEMAELNLIDKKELDKGCLSMPKMENYSDDYTKKIRRVSEQSTDSVPTVSGPDKIREDKIRLDKIREDNKYITEIFTIFRDTVNPTINYGHKTNRKAVTELLKLFSGDFNKLKKLVQYAINVQGKKYAPVITTPYQLKEKLGQLKIYAESQKNSEVKILGL